MLGRSTRKSLYVHAKPSQIANGMSSRTIATTTARSKTSRTVRRKKTPQPKKLVESDESDSTDVITSSDEEDRWKDKKRVADDLPPDYWNIQKLIKYVKAGNTTATMVSLCCLKDYDLTTQLNQLVSSLSLLSALFLSLD